MSTETLTISLENGCIKGSDHISGDVDDTQYVTLTDDDDLNSVTFAKFGTGTPSESGEGSGGDDEYYLDLEGFDDDFTINVKSMDEGDTFFVKGALSYTSDGDEYTINYIGSDGLVHECTIDVDSTNGTGVAGISITCFATGTMIDTPKGLVAVQDLGPGDQVLCGDGQSRPIMWMSQRYVSKAEMALQPEFRPIRIRKDAFGDNGPHTDLIVSPQHRVLLSDWRAELLFGEAEVLVPAVHLTDDRNITPDYQADDVTYYHFMFDSHQTVWSNGLETESFFPGDEAIEGVQTEAKEELYQLFPELKSNPVSYGKTCHLTLKAHEAMSMMGV